MYNKFSGLFALLILVLSCSKNNDEMLLELQLDKQELLTINYFKEIALGFEMGNASNITRKWNAPMKIFLDGIPSSSLINKAEQTVSDINELATDGFLIEIVNKPDLANCYMFFGSASEFIEKFPDAEGQIRSNFALFNVWWDDNNIINKGRIFIDINRPNLTQQKSLILEEITQTLGLGKDSPRYLYSIFYETFSNGGFATEYSIIDKELIRLLYHPDMKVGLGINEVDELLRNILINE